MLLAIEFFRTREFEAVEAALTLSRLPFRGLVCPWAKCSFCWCLSSRSRLAKHLVHSGHSNGFSFVCDLS